MKCQKCGAELENGVLFCRECGSKIEKQVCFCRDCGSKIQGESKFCSNCGAKVELQAVPVEPVQTNSDTEEVPDVIPVVEENHAPDTKADAKQKNSFGDKLKAKIASLWSKLSLFGKFTTIVIGVFSLMCLVAFLAGKTLAGVIALVGLALVVAALLMKKQIIKAPKSWLHIVALALAVVMVVPYVSVFRINYGDAEKFQWSDIVLSDVIPEPNPLFGEVVSNGDTYLSLYIYKIDQSDYDAYVADCKTQGFTVDADEGDRSYYAYNSAGYKLSLYFYEEDGKMHIGVDAAEEYGALEWSASEISSLLPVPESTTGEITQDDEKGFSAYVSNTTIDAYKAYVTDCVNMGFDVDANDADKHYSAQNADGYKLSVDYQGNNVIYISLNVPEYSVSIEVECVENWIFSTYDVDVYIDDSFEGTITHGETETFELTLTKGTYELKFVSDEDDNATGAVTINIQKEESLKYKISCHSSNIDVETITGTGPDETTTPEETTKPDSGTTETTESTESITITVTMGEDELKGLDYTEAEQLLREMGFTVFKYDTLDAGDRSDLHNKIGAVEIKSWEFGKGDFEKGDIYNTDAIVVLWYYEYEEVVVIPNLTVENCADLAALLALRDPCDPSVADFASKYAGQTIEFDGCVTAMQNHGSFTTRWDVLLGAGDFDPNSMRGPNFRLTDVSYYDMNVSGGDSVYVGLNVHVVAKVGKYNANTSLFELDIISIEIR